MLTTEDRKKAITWAFMTAKKFGYTVTEGPDYIWVKTEDSEIGCNGVMDFVSFMSEQSAARAQKVA